MIGGRLKPGSMSALPCYRQLTAQLRDRDLCGLAFGQLDHTITGPHDTDIESFSS